MNFKTQATIVIIFIASSSCFAQGLQFGVGLGFGFYGLEDLKALQSEALTNVSLRNVKSSEKFTNRFYGEYSFGYEFKNKSSLSMIYCNFNNAARNSVSDYSGRYSLDMIIEGEKYGALYGFGFEYSDRIIIGGSISAGVVISEFFSEEKITTNNQVLFSDKIELKGLNIYWEPSLLVKYKVCNNLYSQFRIGFEKNIVNELYLKGDKEMKSSLDADWSGFRVAAGISYIFNSEKLNNGVSRL